MTAAEFTHSLTANRLALTFALARLEAHRRVAFEKAVVAAAFEEIGEAGGSLRAKLGEQIWRGIATGPR